MNQIIFEDGSKYITAENIDPSIPPIITKAININGILRELICMTILANYTDVIQKFKQGAKYAIRQYDIDAEGHELDTYTDYDWSEYSQPGDIIDHRNETVTVCMYKPNEYNQAVDNLNIITGNETGVQLTYEQTVAFRQTIEKAAVSLSDADASFAPSIFPRLKGDGSLVKGGTRICWQNPDGTLCIKRAASDLWDTAENTPDKAPNLWEDVSYYQGYRVIPDVITSTLAFKENEEGYWKDGWVYRAKNNGTVWTPAEHPEAWVKVKELKSI